MADLMERRPPSSGTFSRGSWRRDSQRRQSVQSTCQAVPQTLQKRGPVGIDGAPGSSIGTTFSGPSGGGSRECGLLLGSGGGQAVGSSSAVKTPPRDFWIGGAW